MRPATSTVQLKTAAPAMALCSCSARRAKKPFYSPSLAALTEINRYLEEHGASVYEISPKHISLEELFIETVGKEGGL